MALNEIARHFYEKEIDRLLDSEDRNIIKEKFLDMRSSIDDLYVELGDRTRRIDELESELAAKESLMNTMRCHIDGLGVGSTETLKKFGIDITADDEEPLPFSCDEYTDALFEELEDLRERHQQDCITINQLHTTIDTRVDRYAKLREMRGMQDMKNTETTCLGETLAFGIRGREEEFLRERYLQDGVKREYVENSIKLFQRIDRAIEI